MPRYLNSSHPIKHRMIMFTVWERTMSTVSRASVNDLGRHLAPQMIKNRFMVVKNITAKLSHIENRILMFISLWKGSFDTLSFRIMDWRYRNAGRLNVLPLSIKVWCGVFFQKSRNKSQRTLKSDYKRVTNFNQNIKWLKWCPI